MKIKKPKVFFLLLFLVCLIISTILLLQPMEAEPDAFDRVNLAKVNWEQNLFFDNTVETWLPLHTTLLIHSSINGFDFLILPRLTTLLSSLLSSVYIYKITKIFTKRKNASLLSLALFMFFPLRLFTSTDTISEHFFLLFFSAGSYYLLKKKPAMNIANILFNLSHAIRYESWLFFPFYSLIILKSKNSFIKKIYYAFTFLTFPLYWIYHSYNQTGKFFHFFDVKKSIADMAEIYQEGSLLLSITGWTTRLFETAGFFGLILFFTSILFQIRKSSFSKKTLYFLYPLLIFLSLIFQVFTGSMEWLPHRYLLLSITLMIPLISEQILKINKKLEAHKAVKIALFLLIFFDLIMLTKKSYAISKSNLFFYKDSTINIRKWVKEENITNTNSIYLHNSSYQDRMWMEGAFYYYSQGKTNKRMNTEQYLKNPVNFEYILVEKSAFSNQLLKNNYILKQDNNFILLARR